jgi:hypothetical protein
MGTDRGLDSHGAPSIQLIWSGVQLFSLTEQLTVKIYLSTSATPLPLISLQEAKNRNMLGPVYHGSPNMVEILQRGFDLKQIVPVLDRSRVVIDADGQASLRGPAHGYPMTEYYGGLPAPIHHLGFGIYLTTVKAIGKRFNGDSEANLKPFYLDVPNLLTINFASPRTMMAWWISKGYNMTVEAMAAGDHKAWVKATGNLTRNLRAEYDAVWFKGKTIKRVLDGDQIVVFNPRRIYRIDPGLAKGLDIGAKVTHSQNLDNVIAQYKAHNNAEIRVYDFSRLMEIADPGIQVLYNKYNTPKQRADWKVIVRIQENGEFRPLHFVPPPSLPGVVLSRSGGLNGFPEWFNVNWKRGGTLYNYVTSELTPLNPA